MFVGDEACPAIRTGLQELPFFAIGFFKGVQETLCEVSFRGMIDQFMQVFFFSIHRV